MSEIVAILTLIFVAAALLLILASRRNLPVIPFYLLAGVLVGGVIQEELLLDLAQWGIAFLVFAFAVEVEPLSLREVGQDGAVTGVVQAAVVGAAMYAVGLTIGFDQVNAIYFAVAAALSSSLVTLGEFGTPERPQLAFERLSESIHFVEDLIAIGVVLALSAFVYSPEPAWLQIAAGLGLVVVAVAIRELAFERLASLSGGDVEIMMLTGVSFIVGFIALSELAGVSIVVGAFAAGIAVAPGFPHEIEMIDAIESLEDFFAPIFFITLGALLTVPSPGTFGLALLLVVSVVVLNPLVTIAVLRYRGYDPRTATLAGISLDQVSEFSLIIAIEAVLVQQIAPQLFEAIVLAAIVSMLLASYTGRHGEEVYGVLSRFRPFRSEPEWILDRSRVEEGLSDHVVVVDFGPLGRRVVEACEEAEHPYVVIESDPALREALEAECENFVFGDLSDRNIWQLAYAKEARAIVSVVSQPRRSERILAVDTEADVLVRADDEKTALELLDAGATHVILPDALASDRLVELVRTAIEEGEEALVELASRERAASHDRAASRGPDG